MHWGSAPIAFQQYLQSTDAAAAEAWQLRAMAAIQWPPGFEPRPEAYARIRAYLVAGTAPQADRPGSV